MWRNANLRLSKAKYSSKRGFKLEPKCRWAVDADDSGEFIIAALDKIDLLAKLQVRISFNRYYCKLAFGHLAEIQKQWMNA